MSLKAFPYIGLLYIKLSDVLCYKLIPIIYSMSKLNCITACKCIISIALGGVLQTYLQLVDNSVHTSVWLPTCRRHGTVRSLSCCATELVLN